MFNWSANDYEAAVQLGFPRADGQTLPTAEYFWLKTTIAEWKDGLLGVARTLK
jgi:hypothetical protein